MPKTLWNKAFVLCLVLQTLYMLSFNMVTPLIASFAIVLGETSGTAGLIAGMFSFCALLFRPFVGYASDRVNRSRFMMLGLLLGALAMIGYGLSSTASMLVGFRILHALALSIQTTVITVIAVEFIPHDRIAEGVGYVGIAAMIGMSLGPGIGVWLTEVIAHQIAFFVGAGIMVFAAVLCLLIPKIPVHAPAPKGFSLRELIDFKAIPLSISAMSFAFCAGLTSTFMVLVGTERAISGIAVFFFISSLGMVIVRPIAGRITDKRGLTGIALVGFVCETIAVSVIALSSSIIGITIAAFMRIFGQGACQSSIQGCVLKDATDERRGVASSTFYLGIDAGQGFGAIIGGFISDQFGYGNAFFSGPFVLLIGFCSFLWWRAQRRKNASNLQGENEFQETRSLNEGDATQGNIIASEELGEISTHNA